MFIEMADKIVNLKNVSNINIIKNRNRIVFNFNYSIQIFANNQEKQISDYLYADFESVEELNKAISSIIKTSYFKENFITHKNMMVNQNEISTIKFEEDKLRIIFNLSHNVSFYAGNQKKITSEFVYINARTEEEFEHFIKIIKRSLGV